MQENRENVRALYNVAGKRSQEVALNRRSWRSMLHSTRLKSQGTGQFGTGEVVRLWYVSNWQESGISQITLLINIQCKSLSNIEL